MATSINAGNYGYGATLMTERFIQHFLGLSGRGDVSAYFEEAKPIDLRWVGDAQSYVDGRVSLDAVFVGLFGGPSQVIGSRWFFVEEDGIYRLDDYQSALLPRHILPDAVEVTIQLIDYGFALSEFAVPSDTPVIFRTTNASPKDNAHSIVAITFQPGTSVEQVIAGGVVLGETITGFFGGLSLGPGESADLAFESLAPGTYFLICDQVSADGTPHFELGMVAEVTVG